MQYDIGKKHRVYVGECPPINLLSWDRSIGLISDKNWEFTTFMKMKYNYKRSTSCHSKYSFKKINIFFH